jgi:AbrB family looped-hinge helix DNA binding protein
MTTTIDTAGRLVIPKLLREKAGLQPGLPLEIRLHEGRIEIEPATPEVRIEDDGDFLVAVMEGPTEPVTRETVDRIAEGLRGRHDVG